MDGNDTMELAPAAANLNQPGVIVVTGAGSGIGLALVEDLLARDYVTAVYAGCRKPQESEALLALSKKDKRVVPLVLDVRDAASLQTAAQMVAGHERVDLLINTAGLLHNEHGLSPEKKLADIDTDDMMLAYDVNALGAMRLALAFEPLLKRSHAARFVSLSARVGSIGDNRLGGWYSYRASKAALNMLIRTLAIEWDRARPKIVCAALHPGTVATALSEPFTKGRPQEPFSPRKAAHQLLDVMAQLKPSQSGGFFAWDGQEIPW